MRKVAKPWANRLAARVKRWVAHYVMVDDAGIGPEWAGHALKLGGALVVVAFVSAVRAVIMHGDPKASFLILYATFALLAIPLHRLHLKVPAGCLLLMGLVAIPVILRLL
ncbi:hypothetical protein [Burkholderia pseudomallei]|uniref:hypothetical protein n=1 Tax=Burkholderia pseudomallei TaxID=28450 RepID=UPI0012F47A70|nr:hypothetical protein [Burkholderia pseudomallei]